MFGMAIHQPCCTPGETTEHRGKPSAAVGTRSRRHCVERCRRCRIEWRHTLPAVTIGTVATRAFDASGLWAEIRGMQRAALGAATHQWWQCVAHSGPVPHAVHTTCIGHHVVLLLRNEGWGTVCLPDGLAPVPRAQAAGLPGAAVHRSKTLERRAELLFCDRKGTRRVHATPTECSRCRQPRADCNGSHYCYCWRPGTEWGAETRSAKTTDCDSPNGNGSVYVRTERVRVSRRKWLLHIYNDVIILSTSIRLDTYS